jgi:hypothetical protein
MQGFGDARKGDFPRSKRRSCQAQSGYPLAVTPLRIARKIARYNWDSVDEETKLAPGVYHFWPAWAFVGCAVVILDKATSLDPLAVVAAREVGWLQEAAVIPDGKVYRGKRTDKITYSGQFLGASWEGWVGSHRSGEYGIDVFDVWVVEEARLDAVLFASPQAWRAYSERQADPSAWRLSRSRAQLAADLRAGETNDFMRAYERLAGPVPLPGAAKRERLSPLAV